MARQAECDAEAVGFLPVNSGETAETEFLRKLPLAGKVVYDVRRRSFRRRRVSTVRGLRAIADGKLFTARIRVPTQALSALCSVNNSFFGIEFWTQYR